MQISGREHQPLETTKKSVVLSQIKNRGPYPACKQYFPQLKLGSFNKHRHLCNRNLSNREISCSPPDRYINSSPSIKKHPCQICGKLFARAATLKNHFLVHTGEKPFECSDCGKCFAQSCERATHLRIRTGKKPYECKLCNKSFSFRVSLTTHARIHTGEPYQLREAVQG